MVILQTGPWEKRDRHTRQTRSKSYCGTFADHCFNTLLSDCRKQETLNNDPKSPWVILHLKCRIRDKANRSSDFTGVWNHPEPTLLDVNASLQHVWLQNNHFWSITCKFFSNNGPQLILLWQLYCVNSRCSKGNVINSTVLVIVLIHSTNIYIKGQKGQPTDTWSPPSDVYCLAQKGFLNV
jgi:hypothetical protein